MSNKTKILAVDDDAQIRKMLQVILEAEGYKFEPAKNANEAIRLASSLNPNLIILDLGLPDMDGLDVLTQIRQNSNIPVIILSARDQDESVSKALNLGADDYVVKPFSTDVFLARINANIRKNINNEVGDVKLENGKIVMDLMRHEVKISGQKVSLSPKEYSLLEYLMKNISKMLTYKQILKEVWGPAHAEDTQYLRVYTGQLRQKIEKDPENPEYIITEQGIGYRMEKFRKS